MCCTKLEKKTHHFLFKQFLSHIVMYHLRYLHFFRKPAITESGSRNSALSYPSNQYAEYFLLRLINKRYVIWYILYKEEHYILQSVHRFALTVPVLFSVPVFECGSEEDVLLPSFCISFSCYLVLCVLRKIHSASSARCCLSACTRSRLVNICN